MEELKELLVIAGLPSWAIAVFLIASTILLLLFKYVFRRNESRKNRTDDALHKYASLQETALLKAYRLMYEKNNIRALTQKELEETVSEADDIIMEPFTEYRAYLNDEICAQMYNIHNILAQYKPHPTLKYSLSTEARENLFSYNNKFLKQVESIKKSISKHI